MVEIHFASSIKRGQEPKVSLLSKLEWIAALAAIHSRSQSSAMDVTYDWRLMMGKTSRETSPWSW